MAHVVTQFEHKSVDSVLWILHLSKVVNVIKQWPYDPDMIVE